MPIVKLLLVYLFIFGLFTASSRSSLSSSSSSSCYSSPSSSSLRTFSFQPSSLNSFAKPSLKILSKLICSQFQCLLIFCARVVRPLEFLPRMRKQVGLESINCLSQSSSSRDLILFIIVVIIFISMYYPSY